MQQLMWTLPNKHEDDAKTARVLNTNGHVKRKYCTGTKRLKHAMLRNSRAEFECDTYYNTDEIIAQEHSAFTAGGGAVPAIASTLPRARERGAKAYLRDGEARKQT